jgi:hypothetical protein
MFWTENLRLQNRQSLGVGHHLYKEGFWPFDSKFMEFKCGSWRLGEWLLNRSRGLVIHRGVQYASKFTNVIDSYKMITKVWAEGIVGIMLGWAFKTLRNRFMAISLYQRQMERYIQFIEIWYNRKKAFHFRLQNNRRILETENNFKNVA